MLKQNLKSKTNWLAISTAAIGAAIMYLPMIETALAGYYGFVFIVLAVAQAIIRQYTTGPVSEK